MKIGTLSCRLFGHKFISKKIVFELHYLEGVKQGWIAVRTDRDFHYELTLANHCVRCGIDRK